MNERSSYSARDFKEGFEIEATRIKSEEDPKGFYWFYISLHLHRKDDGRVPFSEIELVEYRLLDDSFSKPYKRVADPKNGFEYKFWLYGFIEVSADIVTRDGAVVSLPATKLTWQVEKEEVEKNGKFELSW